MRQVFGRQVRGGIAAPELGEGRLGRVDNSRGDAGFSPNRGVPVSRGVYPLPRFAHVSCALRRPPNTELSGPARLAGSPPAGAWRAPGPLKRQVRLGSPGALSPVSLPT